MFKKSITSEYETPQVKVVEFRVENGFEASQPVQEPPSTLEDVEEESETAFSYGF